MKTVYLILILAAVVVIGVLNFYFCEHIASASTLAAATPVACQSFSPSSSAHG